MKIIEKGQVRAKAATIAPAGVKQPTTSQTTLFGFIHWGRGEFGSFVALSFRDRVLSIETTHS